VYEHFGMGEKKEQMPEKSGAAPSRNKQKQEGGQKYATPPPE